MYPVENSIEKGVHQPQAPAYASEQGTHTIGAGCALHARAFLLQRRSSACTEVATCPCMHSRS